jgi:Transcriptional regulator, AbiEi antitoxin
MRTKTALRKEAVSQLAEKQHGVAATRDLLALGLSRSQVTRWATEGRLFRVHRGVYAIGRADLTARGKWLAAVKACGPGAVLSHLSAAVLWNLWRIANSLIHVTTTRRSRRSGVRAHTVCTIEPDEWLLVDGIPVTSVGRTLADCAEVLPTRKVVRLLEQAERLGLFDLPQLASRPQLREALAQMAPEVPRVNSDWERDLLDWCEDLGVPRPELNVAVEGFEVDALWPRQRVVVELDSWTFHRSRRAFVEDRRKAAILQLAGYLVLPFTALDEEAAGMLSAAVAAR